MEQLRPAPQPTFPRSASHQDPSAALRTYERCLVLSGLPDPSSFPDDNEMILAPLKVRGISSSSHVKMRVTSIKYYY